MIERYWLETLKIIWSEKERWRRCLDIELAVVEFLHKKGLVSPEEWKEIRQRASFSLKRIQEIEGTTNHDVIAFVTNVEETIGPAGRWIHFGLTSSDVVDTALSMAVQDALGAILKKGEKVLNLFLPLMEDNLEKLIMGRTHGVYAEPMSLGFKFFVYYSEIKRRLEHLEETKEMVRVGKLSGAVGMNLYYTHEEEKEILGSLGLKVCFDATQVLPRDLWAQVSSGLALLAGALEHFALEVRLLHRTEVQEIQEGFSKGQRGSSAMPHKKNPILCERICGLARIVRGLAVSQMESMALWHERDLTNSSCERITLPDQTSLIYYMVYLLEKILKGLKINYDQIRKNLNSSGGVFWSGYLLNKLVEKGLARNDAYSIIQKIALKSSEEGSDFLEVLKNHPFLKEQFSSSELDEMDISLYWKRSISKIKDNLK